MDNPIIQALRRAKQAYMTNVGEPTAQLVGGGVRGYLGLDAPEYADSRGMEAYRNAAAISNTPVVGMPSMAVRAGAKAAPAIAQSLREHAKGFQEYNRALGPAGASQMVVWHGSPHKFDAFDSSKIGTGEGAQAYGHGLYLAESPEVARSYKDTLRGLKTDTQAVVEKLLPERRFTTKERAEIYKAAMDEQTPVQDAARRLGYRQASIRDVDQGVLQRAIAEVREQGQGALYKVDLPDEKIARMLDWDKPLSKQARSVLRSLRKDETLLDATHGRKWPGSMYEEPSGPWRPRNDSGADVMENLRGVFGSDAAAAEALRKAGIPGIRYLDQGSRNISQQVQTAIDGLEYWKKIGDTAKIAQAERVLANSKKMNGYGTSNFVVFPGEEAALTILERNNEIINALRKRKPD